MGFMNKVLSGEKNKESEAASVDEDLPVSEALDEAGARPSLAPDVTGESDEADILAKYADLADGAPVAAAADADAAVLDTAATDVPVETPAETKTESDDENDDLMDVFTSEEEEDVSLSKMTATLEELDAHSVPAEAIDVLTGLRAYNEAL